MKPDPAHQAPLSGFDHSNGPKNSESLPHARQSGESFAASLLGLSRQRGIGSVAIRALTEEFTDLQEVWEADSKHLATVLSGARVPSADLLASDLIEHRTKLLQEGELEYQELGRLQIKVIGRGDPDYPARFRDLRDAPHWLFVDGRPEVMNRYGYLAVVGTREATGKGKKAAQTITMLAAERGLALVSGLAEGIDAAAHEMASRYEMPQVGILGTGIRVVFPKSTSHLRRSIIETGGAIVSEYFPNENYGKMQFVQRNRLQAALASVVAPVEGKTSGGTNHTINFAKELQRRLVAVCFREVDPTNIVFESVAHLTGESFDLNADPDRERLRHVFDQVPGQRWNAFRRPDPGILFRQIRRTIKELSDLSAVTETEKVRLLQLLLADLDLAEYEVVKTRDNSRTGL